MKEIELLSQGTTNTIGSSPHLSSPSAISSFHSSPPSRLFTQRHPLAQVLKCSLDLQPTSTLPTAQLPTVCSPVCSPTVARSCRQCSPAFALSPARSLTRQTTQFYSIKVYSTEQLNSTQFNSMRSLMHALMHAPTQFNNLLARSFACWFACSL